MMNTNTNNESVNVNESVNINESNDDIDDIDIDIDDIDISFSQSSSSPSSSSLWDGNSNDDNDDDDDDDDDDELLVSKPLRICPTVRDKKDYDMNMNIIPHNIIPTTQNDADMVDDALAKEMASLTMIDYDKVTFDVHGLDRVPDDEEPSGVVELEIKFADFNNEIELLLRKMMSQQSKKKKSRKKKTTKNTNNNIDDDIDATVTTMNNIMILHPTYYYDSVLKFLRSERYNTKAAARKMMKHFKYKQTIFCSNNNNDSSNDDNNNNIIMGRDVIQSDLSILDMKALKCGMIQILPIRDTAGRFILVARPELFFRLQQQQQQQQHSIGGDTADEIITDDNCSRAWFYFLNILLKNDEFQKKGIVMIVYMVGLNMTNYNNHIINSNNSTAVVRDNIQSRRQKSMPIKLNAIHICYNNINIRPLIAMQKLYMLSKSHRERLRSHFGNHDEIIFKLQTYGIPVNNNHIQPNNNDLYQSESKSESESAMVSSPIAWHQDRLSMQKNPEDNEETVIKRKPAASAAASAATAAAAAGHGEEENNSTIIVVGLNDVLFGKDRKSKQHPGNIECNQLILSYQNEYENVGKYGKTDIAERIITKIHNEYGGRFLKKEYRKNNSTNDKDNSNHNYCWKEVERNVAREKISHYFRRIRDNNSKKKKKKIDMNISQTTTTTTTTPPVPLSATSLLDKNTTITELSSTATATIAIATATATATTSSPSKRTTPCHPTSSTLLDGFDKGEGDDDDDDDDEKEIISEGGRILKKNRRQRQRQRQP